MGSMKRSLRRARPISSAPTRCGFDTSAKIASQLVHIQLERPRARVAGRAQPRDRRGGRWRASSARAHRAFGGRLAAHDRGRTAGGVLSFPSLPGEGGGGRPTDEVGERARGLSRGLWWGCATICVLSAPPCSPRRRARPARICPRENRRPLRCHRFPPISDRRFIGAAAPVRNAGKPSGIIWKGCMSSV